MDAPHLVATVGPASAHLVAGLARAGAGALRLNAAHVPPGGFESALRRVREAAPGLPLVVDLQGAKMRLGWFEERALRAGEVLHLAQTPRDAGDLPAPHAELFAEVRAGDRLSIDDGRIRLAVEAVEQEAGRLTARALDAGRLRPRKGLGRVDHPVRLAGLTAEDAAFVEAAAGAPGVSFAFSFMADGREAGWVRSRAPGHPVVGKVERREAIEALPGLGRHVDALWICRGDLGVQVGPGDLARFVSYFDPRAPGVPVLMAGQVLQGLVHGAEASRSEVCHLFDLLARGYAGVVLSDETAVGRDPVGAVSEAAGLLRTLRRA